MNEVINIDRLGEWLKSHPEIESVTVDNPYHEKYKDKPVVMVYFNLSGQSPNPDDTCQSKP